MRCADSDGRVTSLDLGGHGLESGGLHPAVFDLISLEYLNLAYNNFNGSQLPSSGFERLTELTHLNLSSCRFSGQVPNGIGRLTNLVSLDLSSDFEIIKLPAYGYMYGSDSYSFSLPLIEQNFETLMANLMNLRDLRLALIQLSNSGVQWCNILASSCPKLKVLSLPFCGLSGPICSSLSSLHSLVVIDLQFNDLSGPVPDFLANFSDLRVLQLNNNTLEGWISPAIFEHKKLVTINLYQNHGISGYLPNFSSGCSLEYLDVGGTNLSGAIPTSISNLTSLKKLGLASSGFSGEIPSSIGYLQSLSALEISGMDLVGSIPSWVANLTSLRTLRFCDCALSGPIPSFIGNLRDLRELELSNCSFSGPIPSYISNLTQLRTLYLHSNDLFGKMELTLLSKLPHLIALDVGINNGLVVGDGVENSSIASFPKIHYLSLSGCNIVKFPSFLRYQNKIVFLDLSYNKMHGAIPRWAWETWNNGHTCFLYLNNNEFTSIGYSPYLPIQDIGAMDLSSNMLEGAIPITRGFASFLDYSNNMFSSIPSRFSSHLSDVTIFKASRNNITGNFPSSFCGTTNIQLLDLSYNKFSGPIPSCLMENVNSLQSLNLNQNQFYGELPDNIKVGCLFEDLDFSGNWIEGQLPRSLVACKNLEILDVGNNQISDSFPCWMSKVAKLKILVLKSNKFFGQVAQSPQEGKSACIFPTATIIDLSSNNFFGPLSHDHWFENLRSMISRDPDESLVMGLEFPNMTKAYRYTTAITYKGQATIFSQILTTLVFIDFSNNAFSGTIPEAVGVLRLLHGLNMSHNSLTGLIPSQLSRLTQLEVLDLSSNEIYGEIPSELTSLDALTVLNLSDNKLVGSIPESPHFMTFSNSSFLGNDGLCGLPLSKLCINTTTPNVMPHHSKKNYADIIILFLFVGLGFGVGFAIGVIVDLYQSENDLEKGRKHTPSYVLNEM